VGSIGGKSMRDLESVVAAGALTRRAGRATTSPGGEAKIRPIVLFRANAFGCASIEKDLGFFAALRMTQRTWTKTADQIFESVDRFYKRTSD
jgi:hypothetical protein